MYTRDALLDMHARSQRSLRGLIDHCGNLATEELAREMSGFGYPSVRIQLAHSISAQEYWLGVLKGHFEVDENEPLFPSTAEIESFRSRVAALVAQYLEGTTDLELNTPRSMMTWQKKEHTLMPALILVRTMTHIYDHKGQVAAMCRLLGRPIPAGLDFPL